jgi:hypothetical protein
VDAEDVRNRFECGRVSTGQIAMFGLTGGLIPWPAFITVLLLRMQHKQLSFGFVHVACFSIGLALTMVSAGVLAALGVRHVASRWSGFGAIARRAPYATAALIVLIGLYTGSLGRNGICHGHRDQAGGNVLELGSYPAVSKAIPPPHDAAVRPRRRPSPGGETPSMSRVTKALAGSSTLGNPLNEQAWESYAHRENLVPTLQHLLPPRSPDNRMKNSLAGIQARFGRSFRTHCRSVPVHTSFRGGGRQA